jgi:hypothetical protein
MSELSSSKENAYMQIRSAHLLIFAAIALLANPLNAQNSWSGTWKLNRSESHLIGPSITIARIPSGYHFDFGAVSFDVGDDGKDYPTIPTRTTIIRPTGTRTWFRAHKVNGKEVDHGTLTVTSDEKRLLIHTVAIDPKGKLHITDEVDIREGTGSGLAGTWRSTTEGVNVSPVFTLAYLGDQRMRRDFIEEGQSYVATLDGKPASFTGPRAAPSVTISLRAVSPTEMRWTDFVNGKPYDHGIDTLSADANKIKETSWPVARPGDRQEAVYDKQR